jgi:hypothetical protein
LIWARPTLDLNERVPEARYLGDPRVVNMSPVSLARCRKLGSRLSQWSYHDARSDGVGCGRELTHHNFVETL